jgi:hypothetical protein
LSFASIWNICNVFLITYCRLESNNNAAAGFVHKRAKRGTTKGFIPDLAIEYNSNEFKMLRITGYSLLKYSWTSETCLKP